jgi:hypothetical protein
MTNTTLLTADALQGLQDRFAFRVAARLSESAQAPGADIESRLRFAREQALQRARAARMAVAEPAITVSGGAGAMRLGQGPQGSNWWVRMGSVLPVVVIAAGLLLISDWQSRTQIQAAAEVDAALLSDAVPPTAYSDPGFVEFLKSPQE